MLDFKVDNGKCTKCKKCAEDCPARIISMEAGFPAIAPDKEGECYKCQHCLAICPTGAVSILGKKPEDSLLIAGNLPDVKKMETLICGRRSVRRYIDEDLDRAEIDKLLDVACHAPTGVNSRSVTFSVVDNRATMDKLRAETIKGLSRLIKDKKMPEGLEFFEGIVKNWEEKGIDVIFRGAPHILVASAPADAPTPEADCMIALATFELYASCAGVGTVWAGLMRWALELVPELRVTLGIPENHKLVYLILFGKPAVKYPRTVQRGPAAVRRITL